MGSISQPQKYLEKALELARKAAALDEVPVGAVIVNATGQIIGEGYNLREKQQDPTSHAEIIAIQNAARKLGSWRLNDCELFVTLEPCPMCLGASQQARVSRITYGAPDPKGGALSLGYMLHSDQRTNHRFEVSHHAFEECGKVLSEFFSRKRRS
jgi:tRNA(adenine34) deaminase